jgi:phospholipase C
MAVRNEIKAFADCPMHGRAHSSPCNRQSSARPPTRPLTTIAAAEAQTSSLSKTPTLTPIKHLIVVVGENRSFDNVFATYVPSDPRQSVWNLLSQGIVDKTGAPGLNAAKALQRQATDPTTYQSAPSITGAFSTLPQPSTTLNGFPTSPCELGHLLTLFGKNPAGISFCSDIGLLPADQPLLSTGGTGQKFYFPVNPLNLYPVPDCRYPSNLPNAPYSLVGASQLNNCPGPLVGPPYYGTAITPTVFSDNTGDPVHRFFQMWQQNDCSQTSRSPRADAATIFILGSLRASGGRSRRMETRRPTIKEHSKAESQWVSTT